MASVSASVGTPERLSLPAATAAKEAGGTEDGCAGGGREDAQCVTRTDRAGRQEDGQAVRGAWFTVFTGFLVQATP